MAEADSKPMGGAGPVVRIESVHVRAYRIPTDGPEEDGTLAWDATTLVLVRIEAGGRSGLGYTYADAGAAHLIRDKLAPLLRGADAMSPQGRRQTSLNAVRNIGRPGIASMALSAVDIALWDLKAKLLGAPLSRLLGEVRGEIEAYGSGGFTNYDDHRLRGQLEGWTEAGIRKVKMKVGARPEEDGARVRSAREVLEDDVELFVDANRAYTERQAVDLAQKFRQQGVVWFEEPVPYWDLEGTRRVREKLPPGMDLAGGEYGYLPHEFLRLASGPVSFLQADITRCGGVTGYLHVTSLCEAFGLPLSSHCAPSLHIALGCAAAPMRHLEYFHDHARIEEMLFDGFRRPRDGLLRPDPDRPGLGLEFKTADAEKFAV